MKFLRMAFALGLLAALITGCGGGSNKSKAVIKTGKATFIVHWPKATTRLIPVASNSILVSIFRNSTLVTSQVIQRPVTGNTTQANFDPLPVDTLTVTASAFPSTDGTGIAQATGSTTLVIQPNANATVNLTMGSTIKSVVVAPATPSLVFGAPPNNSVVVTATALDADGNMVLTSGNTFQWNTGNAKVITVSPTGSSATVVATGIGSVPVTAVETESNIGGQTQVRARGTALIVGTWGKFRADTANSGQGQGSVLSNNLMWTMTTGGPVEGSPAIALDGTIYVGSGDGTLYAVNPTDGSIKWQTGIGGHIKSSPALGSDGTIYFASTNGQIAAADKTDGSIKWQTSFGSSFTSSPTIGNNGNIFIGDADSVIRALDGATGDQIWAVGMAGAIESSGALSADGLRLFIGAGDKKMHALNTADGSEIWSVTTGGAVQSSPALSKTGVLYFGSDDGNVYAVNAADGSPAWASPFQTGGSVSSSPALANLRTVQAVVVGSSDGKVYEFNPATGALIGTPFATGGAVRSSPAISADGTAVVGSDDLNVYLLSVTPSGLSPGGQFRTGGGVTSSAAINASFMFYIGSTDNKLYAFTGG